MKKRGREKQNFNLGLTVGLIIVVFVLIFSILMVTDNNLTGKTVGQESRGIPESEQRCMQSCVERGCDIGDMSCKMANSEKCIAECGAKTNPSGEGEECMNNCLNKYCNPGPDYANCMNAYLTGCESECDMKGDAPDESEMSAEQLCITQCVAAVDPEIRCSNSPTGETGNEVCQRCANDCVHLYEGPCLDDTKLTAKKKECETCEHCYGEPVMGASGEGWDCIVDVECKDASSEFGDNPGSGPGIEEEGYESTKGGVIGNVVEGIVNFFEGLFGGDKE